MLTGRKLLLADDSLTIQKVVSLTFGDEAMEVTTVGGGAEALEKLGESLPDIVLADVFMPEPNGYALCERIKTDERTRHIPVLLLVGTFEPFNEAEARRVGADEVLTKPFQSIRDLVNKVGGLLGGQTDEKTPDAERHEEEATRDLSPFAADARAADPAAETTPAHASAPADVFADFDMDDATIQTTPAAAFDAQHTAPDFSEINEEEQFSDRGETEEAFVLDVDDAPDISGEDDAPAPEVRAATASASAASSHANSHAASPVAESAFDAHASRAAEADDALLELGDIAPSRAATDEADDFILDIGDDDPFDFSDAAPAHDAAAEADLLFAEHAPATVAPEAFALPEALTEPEVFSHSQTPEETEMWASPAEAEPSDAVAASAVAHAGDIASLGELPVELEAPEMSESPSLLFANEPHATEARRPESFTGQEGDSSAQRAPVWDGDPVAASAVAHAGDVVPVGASGAYQPVEPVGADASLPASAPDASSPVASPESSQAAATAAPSLSPEMLDELVRRVVAQMSEQVVREIAWEVVPDLAERLIRQRLQEEQTRPR
ncbi:MAG TPA: response regulator [Pyrinomonadaceae bacterium]|nr:response regulator [Pyrinomonadaceae bacterium]